MGGEHKVVQAAQISTLVFTLVARLCGRKAKDTDTGTALPNEMARDNFIVAWTKIIAEFLGRIRLIKESM